MTNQFLITKLLSLFLASFLFSLALTPLLTRLLYKYKTWKKKPRELSPDGKKLELFQKLHNHKEVNVPRMGGLLIWITVSVITLGFFLLSYFSDIPFLKKMNFLTRSQTWLPLFTLVSASILGLVDDLLVIKNKGKYVGGGLRFSWRVGLVMLIGLVGAWWFHYKLGQHTILIPFYGLIDVGFWFIPFFVLVMLATFSTGVVDGLDGLSAGVLAPIFGAFGVIAYANAQYSLAAFIIVIIGSLITYLWFNIYPARFYMGETGILGLTAVLAVIAFLTNAVILLPLIGFVLVAESLSVILQLSSRKLRGKRIFLAAPIHHHFEALGWHEAQITMRFWIISAVFSGLGLILFFLSRFLIKL